MAPPAYVAAVLADTPRAFWELQDASGLPVDSSGNGLDMTVQAGAGSVGYQEPGPGQSDFSIRLTGVQFDRLRVTTVVNNFSMELWVQAIIPSQNGGLIGNATPPGLNGYSVVTQPSARFQAVAQGVALLALSVNPIASPLITPGRPFLPILGIGGGGFTLSGWSYIVVVRDAGTWRYYFNGAVDTLNAGATAPTAPGAAARSTIGDSFWTWDGRFAYAAIYETALSAAQVAAHYAAMTAP